MNSLSHFLVPFLFCLPVRIAINSLFTWLAIVSKVKCAARRFSLLIEWRISLVVAKAKVFTLSVSLMQVQIGLNLMKFQTTFVFLVRCKYLAKHLTFGPIRYFIKNRF